MFARACRLMARLLIPLSCSVCANGSPQIVFSSVPPYGSFDVVQGQVSGVQPGNYEVALLINVSGLGWFSKPYCDASYSQALPVTIRSDGTWSTPIPVGSMRPQPKSPLLLVPVNTALPCYLGADGVPTAIRALAVASVLINRPYPRQVSFAGQVFDVKTNRIPIGPGPCLYSDSTDNVWVTILAAFI